MPVYILIDHASGFVWSDLRNISGRSHVGADMTPIEAARITDEDFGEPGRRYTEHGWGFEPTGSAYHVYRVDVRGSEAVAVVWDGTDRETIEAIERDCEKVAVVTYTDPKEGEIS